MVLLHTDGTTSEIPNEDFEDGKEGNSSSSMMRGVHGGERKSSPEFASKARMAGGGDSSSKSIQILEFKSWWNEGGTADRSGVRFRSDSGQRRRYCDIYFDC